MSCLSVPPGTGTTRTCLSTQSPCSTSPRRSPLARLHLEPRKADPDRIGQVDRQFRAVEPGEQGRACLPNLHECWLSDLIQERFHRLVETE